MSALFDISKPCAKVLRSPMGGGWIIPIIDEGREVLERFFDEPAWPLPPCGNALGHIVEPYDAEALAEYLRDAGCTWTVE